MAKKKKTAAPAWLVSDAIEFLKNGHPSVLSCVSKDYHSSRHTKIEDWLVATAATWGTRLMTLITHMPFRWKLEELDEVWIGVVARAMKELGLVDPDGRKLEADLRKKE